ncbi:biopolymer transporter ExbD [uncultured Campylobacter sp.]|uniref:ExbD/TolR family protein n=1 Tax=uncultured Campylobacter sp. TaxID=218934 RepID=UPI00263944D7|nr:biopolymer transporter ExbD [uncultured Campylobacter sp.]
MYNFDENPELNITPLVDIMLVLLAILMVAQTAIIYDEKIELPSGSKVQVSENTAEFLLVRIGEDRKVYIDKSSMSLAEFPDNLVLLKGTGKYSLEKPVYIQADKRLVYDDVMFVLKSLKQAGFTKVALQTNG